MFKLIILKISRSQFTTREDSSAKMSNGSESHRTKSNKKKFDSEQSQAKRTDPMVIENNEEEAQPVV